VNVDWLGWLLFGGGLVTLGVMAYVLGRARRDAEIEREQAEESRRMVERAQALDEVIDGMSDEDLDRWI